MCEQVLCPSSVRNLCDVGGLRVSFRSLSAGPDKGNDEVDDSYSFGSANAVVEEIGKNVSSWCCCVCAYRSLRDLGSATQGRVQNLGAA